MNQIETFRDTAASYQGALNRLFTMGARARINDPAGYALYRARMPEYVGVWNRAKQVGAALNAAHHVDKSANLSGLGFVWFTWPVAAAITGIAAVMGYVGPKVYETAEILDRRQQALEAGRPIEEVNQAYPLPASGASVTDWANVLKWGAIAAAVIILLPEIKRAIK